MVGWGGPDGLYNDPAFGPVRPGNGRILTFALGGDARIEPTPFGHAEPPTPAITLDASPETVALGSALYGAYCGHCHGKDAVAGPLPDLRYATADTHEQFEAIVRGGFRASLGMPAFGDQLASDQVRAIQAYVLARAAK